MRITAGKARGRRLKAAGVTEMSPLRPTASKVREAVFNIIGPSIMGSVFLDLYAGTGVVGFEALSRGAGSAVFVEANPVRVEMIKRASGEMGFHKEARVYRMHALSYVRKAKREGMAFDYIFVDPPYQSGEIGEILPEITGRILNGDGLVIVEHPSKRVLPDSVGSLSLRRRYIYGDSALTTYELRERIEE